MRRRGRQRTNRDPGANFLRNRFEVLDFEEIKEDDQDIEDDLTSENNVPLNNLKKRN